MKKNQSLCLYKRTTIRRIPFFAGVGQGMKLFVQGKNQTQRRMEIISRTPIVSSRLLNSIAYHCRFRLISLQLFFIFGVI